MSRMPWAKLTDDQVREVRCLYEETKHLPTHIIVATSVANPDRWTAKKLGEKFGVSTQSMWRIINRRTYKDVE